MNQTVLAYLHLLVWPALILFIVLRFRSSIRYLLDERLTRIDAGGVSASFEKAAREAISAVSSNTDGAAHELPTIDLSTTFHISPHTLSEAYGMADHYRAGQPVILDVTEAKADVALQIVAYALGLISYGKGDIDVLAKRVFLLGHNEQPGESDRVREPAYSR